jgi:hypothetical protein
MHSREVVGLDDVTESRRGECGGMQLTAFNKRRLLT